MMKLIGFILCCVLAHAEDTVDDEVNPLQVDLGIGKVVGSIMKTRLGKDIFSFRGVRYAEPPTGQQRFNQAIPVEPWNGTFDASTDGPQCPQLVGENQSEDCLRLSVYSTKLPSSNESSSSSSLRPVIVFFHPGGFSTGSGQSAYYGPDYLLDEEIVLVSVNSRLGALGFLSTGDSLAPGNLGLKDQVEALRWVKKHVEKFGGDPNCVTIFGYSSGSWGVILHLVSPMSRGLFHRAIAMSGSPIYQSPLPSDQKNLTKETAELLGCPTDTTGNMLICLNTKTAQEIATTTCDIFKEREIPAPIWMPVVEPEIPGVERFLTAQPADLIRQGSFHSVPIIAGITRDEFGGSVKAPVEQAREGDTSKFDDVNANWTRVAPISFWYEQNSTRSLEISEQLRKFYLHDKRVGLDNYQGLADLYSDAIIGFGVHRFVNLMGRMVESSNVPVYYYQFAYQGRYSSVTWSDGKPFGVSHIDDLMYLFNMSLFFSPFKFNAPEIEIVKRMTSMWAHFAKTGEPIPDTEEFSNITWTPFNPSDKKYLEIDTELVMKSNLNGERMEKWEKLFPLPPLNHSTINQK